MAVLRVMLLVIGVASLFVRPARLAIWMPPCAAALVAWTSGAVSTTLVRATAESLAAPLAFLLAAVPLALLLDEVGLFTAVAALVDGGRRLHLSLWCLAALVTTVLNLDASVVLLTPLYIRIARRHGHDPLWLAFQPVLLASLASSALPVSNLTNLLAAERFDLRALEFVVHLGPASLVATVVGWFGYRRVAHVHPRQESVEDPVDPRALRRGLPVVAFVALGFTLGDHFGVEAWVVAVVADVWLVALVRTTRWRSLPVDPALLTLGLGVLAAGAAPDLGLGRLFGHGDLVVASVSAAGAATINNLPALLVGMPLLSDPDRIWAMLLGVNMGPAFLLTGSLAGLLWRDTARSLGVDVGAADYSRVGVRVGGPALAAAILTLLATNALVG